MVTEAVKQSSYATVFATKKAENVNELIMEVVIFDGSGIKVV